MDAQASPVAPAKSVSRLMRIGSVSYLNAKPLIYGLEDSPDTQLILDVPARLAGGLVEGRYDVALLPVIDYQRIDGLRVLRAGGIGCDGPTLTVRIFSGRPISQMRTLACDTESHTSVALARILLAERFGLHPHFIDLSATANVRADAMLLIGDKVVCEEPAGMDHQLDLGQAWRELTGLPFVFAIWTARRDVDLGDLPDRLQRAKRDGLAHVREIVTDHAIARGWPAGVAMQYLTVYLKYDIGERQMEAIRHFHQLAAKHGVLKGKIRELVG